METVRTILAAQFVLLLAFVPCLSHAWTVPDVDVDFRNTSAGCVANLFVVAGQRWEKAVAYEKKLLSGVISHSLYETNPNSFLVLLGMSSPGERQAFIQCFGPEQARSAERPSHCANYSACSGHGQCNLSSRPVRKRYQCLCDAGFHGRFCDWQVDNCFARPCQHGAVCENVANTYKCHCSVGYRGRHCEETLLTESFFSQMLKRQEQMEGMLARVMEQNERLLSASTMCTLSYKVHTQPATWSQAVAGCEKDGGILATVHSQEQQNMIMALPALRNAEPIIWLGATDAGLEGRWVWVNGQGMSYTNWKPNYLQNVALWENCLAMMRNSADRNLFSWDDLHCASPLQYVCEYH